MKKRNRNWRKSHYDDKFSLPSPNSKLMKYPCPMDPQEREELFRSFDTESEELVRSFESLVKESSLLWKKVVAVILLIYTNFLVYSVQHHTRDPWQLYYHAYFKEDIESWKIIFIDWVAILACMMSVLAMLLSSKYYRKWLWYSFSVGLSVAVFWLSYMIRMPNFRWNFIWLPFGPLCGVGIGFFVDHLILKRVEQVRELKALMYALRAHRDDRAR